MIDTTTTRTDAKSPESVARVRLHGILAGMMSGHCGIHVGLVWRGFPPVWQQGLPPFFVDFGPARRSAGVANSSTMRIHE